MLVPTYVCSVSHPTSHKSSGRGQATLPLKDNPEFKFFLQSKLIQNCPNDLFPKFPHPAPMCTLCFQGVQVLYVEALATFQCATILKAKMRGEKGLACWSVGKVRRKPVS